MKNLMAAALVCAAGTASAQQFDGESFTVNEEFEVQVRAEPGAHVDGLSELISGWAFRTEETRELQMDDFLNPAFIFVDQAREVWETVEGAAGESCASCHGAPEDMAGVRPVYPRWNEEAGEVRTLAMQVNACRTERMEADAWGYTSGDMVNMEALLSSVSRGMPVNVAIDGPVAETWEMGREIYYTRFGQLDLSCASCHEQNYGNYIRADYLSQGHINGFPTYRLKNARLNATHSRFAGCVRDTRAQTFSSGSPEFVALELYLASRGNGLSVEGPSVRN